jgi:hypothetical protein
MTQLELLPGIEAERESLEVHVDVCAQRYALLLQRLENMDQRFDRMETVVQEIHDRITKNQDRTLKTYLTWAGAIITGLISVVGYLLATFVIGK